MIFWPWGKAIPGTNPKGFPVTKPYPPKKPFTFVGAVTPGGRHCFLTPWRGHTLIGTTDKPYLGHPDDYRVTRESIQELIQEVNGSFEGLGLTLDDVLYSYGGLRPLLENRDFSGATVECLGRLYGTECGEVLALARRENGLAEPLNSDGERLAQVMNGVRYEMARTLKKIRYCAVPASEPWKIPAKIYCFGWQWSWPGS